jgi:hypothetical protein
LLDQELWIPLLSALDGWLASQGQDHSALWPGVVTIYHGLSLRTEFNDKLAELLPFYRVFATETWRDAEKHAAPYAFTEKALKVAGALIENSEFKAIAPSEDLGHLLTAMMGICACEQTRLPSGISGHILIYCAFDSSVCAFLGS